MHLIKVHIYSYYYLLIVTINNKFKSYFFDKMSSFAKNQTIEKSRTKEDYSINN
ncbi:hypothetical protein GZD61_001836 [Campylobacter coli]|nr:hypothetical protein [Campylobacter coli]EDO9647007.1 hypothetical protein [Campylobacter coli]